MSFVHDLIARRVPQILGTYVAGSWLLFELMQQLVGGSTVSTVLVDLMLWLLILFTPTVAIVAYFHGAPGRDPSPRFEKLAIAGNAMVAAGVLMLMFGGRDFATGQSGSESAPLPWLTEEGSIRLNANIVAVMPFEPASGDPLLSGSAGDRVGQSVVDYMGFVLPGGSGPRTADRGTMIRLWDDLRSSDRVPSFETRLEIARRLGAAELMTGRILGTADRLTLTASLFRVPSGEALDTESVEGSLDDLPALVARLAVLLLVGEDHPGAIAQQRLSQIPRGALEAYLEGVFAAQVEDFRLATDRFDRAIDLDSTFHEAAVQRVLSVRFESPGSPRERDAFAFAWSLRAEMAPHDRAVLSAVIGAGYGDRRPTAADLIASATAAVDAAPDRPETWQFMGRWHLTYGRLTGKPDWPQFATGAMDRLFQLQALPQVRYGHIALFAELQIPASPRLLERAEFLLDLERRWAERGGLDPADDPYFGWHSAMALGDTAALARMRGRRAAYETFAGNIGPAVGTSAWMGWPLTDSKVRLAALENRAVTADERRRVVGIKQRLAVVEGRPNEASEILRGRMETHQDPFELLVVAMNYALNEPGYQELGEWAAEHIATRADTLEPSFEEWNRPYVRGCYHAIWQMSQGDTVGVRADIDRIEAVARPGETLCPALLGATLEAEVAGSAYPDRPAPALARADSILRRGELTGLIIPGNLVVARLYERRGELEGALAASRRWAYNSDWAVHIPAYLRHEGKYAKALGDVAAAMRAYTHYLTLRTAPEAPLVPQRDSVVRELAELPVEDERGSPPRS